MNRARREESVASYFDAKRKNVEKQDVEKQDVDIVESYVTKGSTFLPIISPTQNLIIQ